MYKIFLVIPPGLENVAISELGAIFPHLKPIHISEGIEFECDLETLYKLNMNLRIPNRILIRFGEFKANSFSELFNKTVRLPWKQFLKKDTSISIRTTCHKSKLYHNNAVTQRVHQAIEANLSHPVSLIKNEEFGSSKKQQLLIVRVFEDIVTISIDSSGNPLHMRGYRERVSKAPLRENLAAGLILAAGWDPQSSLIDPFCGSGTIPIEAMMIANNQAPGLFRDFAFENWPGFKQNDWQEIRKSRLSFVSSINPTIIGSDRDRGAILMSEENAKKAKLNLMIQWENHSFSDIQPTGNPGWIITNPPYGVRIKSNKDIRNLYARFGDILRERFSGWQVLFLCNSFPLVNQTRLNPKSLLTFTNGGIPVQAFYSKID